MLKRTLTAIVLIAMFGAFIALSCFVSPIFVDMFILIFSAIAVFEMVTCFKKSGYKMYIFPIVFDLVLSYPVFYLFQYYWGMGIQGLIIVLLASCMIILSTFTFKPTRSLNDNAENCEANACTINDLFANIFVLIYPFLFMTTTWILSIKYSAVFSLLYAAFVPVLGSDTFAYFFGSLIGGKKLCPKISPKKTVAGGIGGLIGGIAFSLVFWAIFEVLGDTQPKFIEMVQYKFFFDHNDAGWMWKSALVYSAVGLIVGFVSELGDLAASKIKRAIGIKDYGKIFPGHGGVMDRIDSIMYSLVVLLIAFSCIYQF